MKKYTNLILLLIASSLTACASNTINKGQQGTTQSFPSLKLVPNGHVDCKIEGPQSTYGSKITTQAEKNADKASKEAAAARAVANGKSPKGQESAILGILATAAVTKGIDLIGSKITDAAAEKPVSAEAITNVLQDPKVGCLIFEKNNDYKFVIAMPVNSKQTVISPKVISYEYKKSISGKTRGSRGVVLQIDITKPGQDSLVSQTINLGNLSIKDGSKILNKEAPLIMNPFIVVDTQTGYINANYPMTISLTMNEVRDANKLLQLGADIASEANDGVTNALIEKLGLDEPDSDAGATAGEPGSGGPPPNN